MNSTKSLGILALLTALTIMGTALGVFALVSRSPYKARSKKAVVPLEAVVTVSTKEESGQPPPEGQAPMAPAPPLLSVFSARKISQEKGSSMKVYVGKRIVATGVITYIATTGYSHHTFWEVPEGLAILSLGNDGDHPHTTCVLSGGLPSRAEIGKSVQVEGTYRGLIATSGVPLMVDCEVRP